MYDFLGQPPQRPTTVNCIVYIYYEVISFQVKRELKEKMERLRHINWSEVVRRAIEAIK